MPDLWFYGIFNILKKWHGSSNFRKIRAVILKLHTKTTAENHSSKTCQLRWKIADDGKKDVSCVPCHNTKQVFRAEQELLLKDYLITPAKMHFGLTRVTFAKFAYSFADVNSITIPDSWKTNQSTGKHWLHFFFKRVEYVNA